jgi:hypothetical protein
MKVRDLIELLEDADPNATVLIVSQQHWPFENEIHGIALREDVGSDEACDDDEGEARFPDGTSASDVLIVEGAQLRYGNRAAWEVARRD